MAKKEPKSKEWVRLPEIEELVQKVIKWHHPHLENCTFVGLGKPQSGKSHGKINVAKIRKASEFHKALFRGDSGKELDYTVEVGMDLWPHLDTEKHKIPVIDHELCHAVGKDANGVAHLQPHDVEEFEAVIRRHGLWQPELIRFVEASKANERVS